MVRWAVHVDVSAGKYYCAAWNCILNFFLMSLRHIHRNPIYTAGWGASDVIPFTLWASTKKNVYACMPAYTNCNYYGIIKKRQRKTERKYLYMYRYLMQDEIKKYYTYTFFCTTMDIYICFLGTRTYTAWKKCRNSSSGNPAISYRYAAAVKCVW